MSLNFGNRIIKSCMYDGDFGLERENLRVDSNGFLSHTRHPFDGNPNISKDFCECQTEIITGVSGGAGAVVRELEKLHNTVVRELLCLETGSEYVWPFSNPPYIRGEEDIPIAKFDGTLKEKEDYRHYLAKKYGKTRMLFSGIHCNYSFSENLLLEGFRESGFKTLGEYKNAVYLELAKKLVKYSWLIVYLTAASSVADSSFLDGRTAEKYASARCGEVGYWNDFIPVLAYDTLENYVQSIQSYIDKDWLLSASELYYPIRLKPRGCNTLENLKVRGVNHIELRMLDVNPLTPVGIFEEDVSFIQLMILYLMSLEDEELDETQQIQAVENIKKSAEYDCEKIMTKTDCGTCETVGKASLNFLNDMEKFFNLQSAPDKVFKTIEYQKNKVTNPQNRYAVIIRNRFGDGFAQKGLDLAKQYAYQTKT